VKIPRQFFTKEFKEEAVKLVVDGKLTIAEAARRLSLSPQTLKNWVTKQRSGNLNVAGNRSVSELEAEVSKLRKEIAEARLEKEILNRLWRTLPRDRNPVRVDGKVAVTP
jgi:transposase